MQFWKLCFYPQVSWLLLHITGQEGIIEIVKNNVTIRTVVDDPNYDVYKVDSKLWVTSIIIRTFSLSPNSSMGPLTKLRHITCIMDDERTFQICGIILYLVRSKSGFLRNTIRCAFFTKTSCKLIALFTQLTWCDITWQYFPDTKPGVHSMRGWS